VTHDELTELRLALRRKVARASFRDFVRMAWPIIEPTRPFMPSIAVDAVSAALQAVAERRIRRLAIALPPGCGKSLVGAVAWPAWLLLRTDGAARVMAGSYSSGFAERDSTRCRELIGSPWYRALVGGTWNIQHGRDRVDEYWTSAGGKRVIASPGGRTMGERVTYQVIDDALSGADIFSKSAKAVASRWVCEQMPSRMEDLEEDPRTIIGQRLCVDDPIASVLERGFSLLQLPAVLVEGDVPCVLLDDHGAEVWRDPRAQGEPLLSLLSPEALDMQRIELGSVAFAAQYMQKPRDDSSATIRRAWWRFHRPPHVSGEALRPGGCDLEAPAVNTPDAFDRVTIAADLTFGSLTGDFCSIQAWGAVKGGRYLLDRFHRRCGFEEQLVAIREMAAKFPGCKIVVEKAANGAAIIEQLRKVLPGVVAVKPIGSKAARLAAVAPTVESGACHLPLGAPWLEDFVEEMAGGSKHDDDQDAAAYALHDLARQVVRTSLFCGGLAGGYDPATGESWRSDGSSWTRGGDD
jgi:predicted phage terminase large subunit-like protein